MQIIIVSKHIRKSTRDSTNLRPNIKSNSSVYTDEGSGGICRPKYIHRPKGTLHLPSCPNNESSLAPWPNSPLCHSFVLLWLPIFHKQTFSVCPVINKLLVFILVAVL